MSSNKHGIVPVEPMYFPHSSSCSWGLAFWCFSFLSEITEITEFNILPVRFVAPNWTKSCRSVCCTSAFVFWRNCGCLQSSVLCFGARSMQSCWMPKVQALSNCFLPQANPRARQSSSAPDALYLKSSKWWESHRHLGVKDGISLSTTVCKWELLWGQQIHGDVNQPWWWLSFVSAESHSQLYSA